ncbi:MAG: heat-inducible transcription repressor HrcA [Clostridiales bacterium]|nr:heat-inducible transcription repressor HrcA [Clostridiales bacterium]
MEADKRKRKVIIDEKNKRKHEIVLVAVDEYIKTAQPITSGQLNLHFKDISSATIRNELNALESMGYFRQLHTSGGRVPTGLAYKEYVNSLLDNNKLNYDSIKQVLSSYESKSVSLISTLSTLAKRLSRATNCPTVLVQHGLKNLTIENIQIVPLIQKDALLLVETNAGIIDDNISLDPNIDRPACNEASQYLTSHFKGKTIGHMIENINTVCLNAGAQIIQFKELIDSVAQALVGVIQTRCDVSNENPTKLLDNLSKNEMDDAKNVFEFLEDSDNVIDAVKTDSEGLNFTIGEDDEDSKLKGGMMMSAPIVINGVSIASLALVGPKRIDYANVAAALKFIVNQIDNEKGGDK